MTLHPADRQIRSQFVFGLVRNDVFLRVSMQKNAYRPPNKDHTEEPNDTSITERIPWGPGAISPGRGFQRAASSPLGLRSTYALVSTRTLAVWRIRRSRKRNTFLIILIQNPVGQSQKQTRFSLRQQGTFFFCDRC